MADAEATKICAKCKVAKPRSAFHKNRRKRDGCFIYCKECVAARNALPEIVARNAANAKKRNATARAKALSILNQRTQVRVRPFRYEKTKDSVKKSREKYPERERARKAVNHEVEFGRMPRVNTLTCTDCGKQATHYHHHNGYSEKHRLDVIPVCSKCHGKAHRKWSDEELSAMLIHDSK